MNSLKSNTVKNQVTFDDMKLATDGLVDKKVLSSRSWQLAGIIARSSIK